MIFFVGRIGEAVVVSISVEDKSAEFVVFLTLSVLEDEATEATVDFGAAKVAVSVLKNCVKLSMKVEGVVSRSENASLVVAEAFSLSFVN